MITVLLVMKRQPIADFIIEKGRAIRWIEEPDQSKVIETIANKSIDVALIEVSESKNRDVAKCLDLSKSVRDCQSDCKLILMCPEQDRVSVEQVILAKRTKLIDDFVFYEASIDYLISKLMSI